MRKELPKDTEIESMTDELARPGRFLEGARPPERVPTLFRGAANAGLQRAHGSEATFYAVVGDRAQDEGQAGYGADGGAVEADCGIAEAGPGMGKQRKKLHSVAGPG